MLGEGAGRRDETRDREQTEEEEGRGKEAGTTTGGEETEREEGEGNDALE